MLTDKPELRLSDHQYWINLVSRLGFDTSVYHPSSRSPIVPLVILNRYFDSTQRRMLSISQFFDRGMGQTIFAEEAAEGLQSQGIYTSRGSRVADEAFKELMDMISVPRNGSMDGSTSSVYDSHTPEFLVAWRNLRLAAIFHQEKLAGQDTCTNLHKYGEVLNSYYPIGDPIAFLFKPAAELFLNSHSQAQVCQTSVETCRPVKLLLVHDASKKDILGLTIKYQLEPQYVEDLFTLSIQEPKAILENMRDTQGGATNNAAAAASVLNMGKSVSVSPLFGSLMGAPPNDLSKLVFMVVPILRLSEHSRNTLRKYQVWQECGMPQTCVRGAPGDAGRMIEETLDTTPSVDIVIERCNLAMFVSDIAEGSTVISFSSEWVELWQFKTVRMIAEEISAKCIGFCKRLVDYIWGGCSWGGDPSTQNANGSKHSETAGITSSDHVSDTYELPLPSSFLNSLRTSSTQLRFDDAHTFMLIAFRDITEDYLLIADAYKAFLERIGKKKGNLSSNEVSRISEGVKRLSWLKGVVDRVATVAETISSHNQWSGDATSYLYAIRSNVTCFLENVSTCKKKAESIVNERKQLSETKTSSMLDIVTLFIVMLIIVQLLNMLC